MSTPPGCGAGRCSSGNDDETCRQLIRFECSVRTRYGRSFAVIRAPYLTRWSKLRVPAAERPCARTAAYLAARHVLRLRDLKRAICGDSLELATTTPSVPPRAEPPNDPQIRPQRKHQTFQRWATVEPSRRYSPRNPPGSVLTRLSAATRSHRRCRCARALEHADAGLRSFPKALLLAFQAAQSGRRVRAATPPEVLKPLLTHPRPWRPAGPRAASRSGDCLARRLDSRAQRHARHQ